MSWQGLPFRLLEAGNIDQLFLKLSSLPKLTIDTPTDYNQLALTVGATFLGGIIPALIAWRTFHVNAKNVKKERQEQQRFLQSERSKQQIFMMSERAYQFASMKEDRELQMSISQKTINAQVISSNRQNWINELKQNVADYCAFAFNHYDVRADYLIEHRRLQKTNEDIDRTTITDKTVEMYNRVSSDFSTRLEMLKTSQNKMDKSAFLILLSLNYEEQETKEIEILILSITQVINSLSVNDESGFVENASEVHMALIKLTDKIMEVVRIVLKREWIRVKLCE